MIESDELTLDDLDLLIAEEPKPTPKFIRRQIVIPPIVDRKYVTLDEFLKYECSYPTCPIKTRFRVEGIPYCSGHLAYPLMLVIQRLHKQLSIYKGEQNACE